MTFSQLLHAVRQNPQAVVIPSVWGQGRAGFGGLAVALVFEAMRAKVPAGRPAGTLARMASNTSATANPPKPARPWPQTLGMTTAWGLSRTAWSN